MSNRYQYMDPEDRHLAVRKILRHLTRTRGFMSQWIDPQTQDLDPDDFREPDWDSAPEGNGRGKQWELHSFWLIGEKAYEQFGIRELRTEFRHNEQLGTLDETPLIGFTDKRMALYGMARVAFWHHYSGRVKIVAVKSGKLSPGFHGPVSLSPNHGHQEAAFIEAIAKVCLQYGMALTTDTSSMRIERLSRKFRPGYDGSPDLGLDQFSSIANAHTVACEDNDYPEKYKHQSRNYDSRTRSLNARLADSLRELNSTEEETMTTERTLNPANMPIVMEIEGYGPIVIAMDENMPTTVNNFREHVRSGHYNGTLFHRLIKDFMVQGGQFRNYELKDEAPSTGPIQNEATSANKNTKYSIAMARTSDPHSAVAQFFINFADNGFLNHTQKSAQGWGYARFGEVIYGQDVIDRLNGRGGPVRTKRQGFHDDVPVEPIKILSAYVAPGGGVEGDMTLEQGLTFDLLWERAKRRWDTNYPDAKLPATPPVA